MMSRHKAEKSPQKMTVECRDIFEVYRDIIRQDNLYRDRDKLGASNSVARKRFYVATNFSA